MSTITIQKTLERGFWSGFFTGMGATVSDMFYASVGAFGIHLIADFDIVFFNGPIKCRQCPCIVSINKQIATYSTNKECISIAVFQLAYHRHYLRKFQFHNRHDLDLISLTPCIVAQSAADDNFSFPALAFSPAIWYKMFIKSVAGENSGTHPVREPLSPAESRGR